MSLYGLLAEFDTPAGLVAAARRAREDGYTQLEAFSPVPVEEVWDVLGVRRTRLPALTAVGGLAGAAAGYAIQYYTNVLDYPLTVGGRPHHSWPAFTVVTFELAVLLAAVAAGVGMLALNGLPRLHHPVFDVPAFDLAGPSRFYLCVRATDPRFDPDATQAALADLGAVGVWEIPS